MSYVATVMVNLLVVNNIPYLLIVSTHLSNLLKQVSKDNII